MTTSGLTNRRPEAFGARAFAQSHPWDRSFFLAGVLLIWAVVLTGFVPEIVRHVAENQRPFPLIVHVHGVIFVGWLVLLTTQVLLIRDGRPALHRRLGLAGAILAASMIVVGPATAIVMDRLDFGTPDDNTPFLFVQMTDIASFAVLAGAGLLLRRRPAAHKRLMLLSTLYISDAGFARFLQDPIAHQLGSGYWPYFASFYLAGDILILGVGAYDLVTRRRLHPAYLAAIIGIAAIQLMSVHFRLDAGWKVEAAHLLGH